MNNFEIIACDLPLGLYVMTLRGLLLENRNIDELKRLWKKHKPHYLRQILKTHNTHSKLFNTTTRDIALTWIKIADNSFDEIQ